MYCWYEPWNGIFFLLFLIFFFSAKAKEWGNESVFFPSYNLIETYVPGVPYV